MARPAAAYIGLDNFDHDSRALETAQYIANHESPRTTKLYGRRQDESRSTK
ncbi:MAG: hypothetical protein ACRETL_00345 [Gammaproteobacteria bacterium]